MKVVIDTKNKYPFFVIVEVRLPGVVRLIDEYEIDPGRCGEFDISVDQYNEWVRATEDFRRIQDEMRKLIDGMPRPERFLDRPVTNPDYTKMMLSGILGREVK